MFRAFAVEGSPMQVTFLAMMLLCQITGKVVSITDGDTLIVRESPTKSVTVRLVHIDAPEKGQAFGTRARQTLSELAYGKDAEVIGISKDRYGRTLGEVIVDGKSINLEMVRQGMAWAYVDFSPPPEYESEQAAAKMSGRGLWADREPVPPWVFRKQRKTAAK
jgi:micrococcal nuclease